MGSRQRLWPVHVILAVGAAAMVAPFLWQLITSLQTTGETTSVPPHFLPKDPTLANFLVHPHSRSSTCSPARVLLPVQVLASAQLQGNVFVLQALAGPPASLAPQASSAPHAKPALPAVGPATMVSPVLVDVLSLPSITHRQAVIA